MKDNHDLFKTLAKQYVDMDGNILKEELIEIDKNKKVNTSPQFHTNIYQKINKLKIRKYIIITEKAAAIFLLFFISLFFIKNSSLIIQEKSPVEIASQPNFEIIYLSADLPKAYHISHVEQDREETIYYINNSNNEDVVLTIKKSEEIIEKDGLKEINIDNTMAYGLAKADYSIIVFEKDGNRYTLTCKYDYSTLIELSKSIL